MIRDDTPANLGESEPPHIKNWFSSYEYESFVLETNDNFGFSEDQGSQGYENECSTGNVLKPTKTSRELVTIGKNESMLIKCNQSEEENKCQKTQNRVLESSNSPLLSPEPPGVENWFSSYVYESPEVDTIDDLILSDHKESMVDCSEQTKEFEKDEHLCVTPDDLICKQTSECDNGSLKTEEFGRNENMCVTPNDLICKQTTECDNGILKTNELEKDETLCIITPDDLVCKQSSECDNASTKDDKSPTELPHDTINLKSSDDESRKLEETGDGFVSIQSKKENDEKSKKVNGVDQKRRVVSSVNKMKKSDERVTLGDVTNIHEEHSSVTGKWKCPRKRKPDVGPPLKQLRLGQWFHHV